MERQYPIGIIPTAMFHFHENNNNRKPTHYAGALKVDRNIEVHTFADSGKWYVRTPAV